MNHTNSNSTGPTGSTNPNGSALKRSQHIILTVSAAFVLVLLMACGGTRAAAPATASATAPTEVATEAASATIVPTESPTEEATNEATAEVTEEATSEATAEVTEAAAESNAIYLWPASLPDGFTIDAANSKIDADGFELKAVSSTGNTPITIAGSKVRKFTVWQKSGDVTVRGQAGVAFDEMDGDGVTWKENGLNYWVIANIDEAARMQLVESLQALGQADWSAKLAE